MKKFVLLLCLVLIISALSISCSMQGAASDSGSSSGTTPGSTAAASKGIKLEISAPSSSLEAYGISYAIITNTYSVTSMDVVITCIPTGIQAYTNRWLPENGSTSLFVPLSVEGQYRINVTHNGIDNQNRTISVEEDPVFIYIGPMVISTINIIPGMVGQMKVNSSDVVYLENASNLNLASGTFGNPAKHLAKNTGSILTEGTDYINDQSLASIYDTKNNDVFDVGRFFRVVYDTININSSTSLALTPVAKDLSIEQSPLSNQIYIDPAHGKFVLPRPAYWSKCESVDNVTSTAEINGYLESTSGLMQSAYGGKFSGYSVGIFGSSYYREARLNFGAFPEQGTVSCWVYTNASGALASAGIDISNDDIPYASGSPFVSYYGMVNAYSNTISIPLNGTNTSSVTTGTWANTYHFYVVWNKNGLSDGSTVKVYLNGVVCSTNAAIPAETFTKKLTIRLSGDGRPGGADSLIDNLKVWKEVVSETPDWEYNNGTGREDALHPIYGPTNNYKPSNDIKVGYYYGN